MSDVAADVHALIQDLLPVLVPGARFDDVAAEVVLPVGRAEPRAVTTTIVGRCARAPRHEWPGLVEEWLRDVGDRAALAIGEIELLGNVNRLLRLRIVPRTSEATREGFVVTEFGPFFDAMVVIEHPEYGGPLTRERAARLHLSRLGTRAIDNTQKYELIGLNVTERPLTMTESVRLVTKPGSRYVSVALTGLAEYLPRRCPYGALVGVPDHNKVLLYPVTSAAVYGVLPVFADVVAEMHDGSADRCSREIFWWADGHLLPVRERGVPPAELGGIVGRLPEETVRPAGLWRRAAAALRAAVRRTP
ncbi:hypothetical protein [Actinomadura sp. DC4]|uniref:hypothetical protein n=1 Tax=Actinomadura sp. DC4 TaxID=3055069 RepID=UPI0025AF5B4F|nr:hypothetical protein [Actinomadura sp. DC4]MDN3356856.1 hypothetical protein [Actinomadura sp. DC4]